MAGRGERQELPVVLLIDDNPVSRELTATLLILRGYPVHTAADGSASLEMLTSARIQPGVVLIDAQAGGLNGLDLILKLRQITPAEIYFISGSDLQDDIKAAADGILPKPFSPDALEALRQNRISQPVEAAPPLPVIIPETLAQFRQMMPEKAVREVYFAVAADLRKQCAALEAAIASGNFSEIRRIGHSIKGGCGMAGAAQVSRIGARIETESNQLDNLASLLHDLVAATRALESMLEHEFPV
ncbi:MAG TPA: response regulator [Terriglobia bacterium]|nr:response regulator [Terriglobia bacterium]